MADLTLKELLSLIPSITVTGLLAVILVAVLKGGRDRTWVWGWQYVDVCKRLEAAEAREEKLLELLGRNSKIADNGMDAIQRKLAS